MAINDIEGDDKTMARKLHLQFGHPTPEALIQLLKQAKLHTKSLSKEVHIISNNCIICLRNKKSNPQPVVCLPLARRFNELVGMDLKYWNRSTYFLVMVDIATRFCQARVVTDKIPKTIIKAIFVSWITTFGAPRKFLTDNGGEFVNHEIRDLSKAFSIKLLTTAAESPWSNGICERLNGTLASIVRKIIEETRCDIQMALAWAIAARNAFVNKSGVSPNQLVFGFNPSFPNIYDDNAPGSTLEDASTEIVFRNNAAKNKAREIFVHYEANEKIRKALRHNIRYSDMETLKQGDEVLYKRKDDIQWQGPGIVTDVDLRAKTVAVNDGGHSSKAHAVSVLKVPEINLEEVKMSENEDIDDIQTNEGNEELAKSNSRQTRGEASESITREQSPVENENNDHTAPNENIQNAESVEKNVIDLLHLKCGQRFQGFDPKTGQKISGKIIGRAGKARGTNKYCYNIENDSTGDCCWMHMDKIKDLTLISNDLPMIVLFNNTSVRKAKFAEIDNWLIHDVFEEVENVGQPTISVRWVITERILNGEFDIKARLVARGFEEDTSHLNKEAPTCGTDIVRLTTTIASSMRWNCHTVDVKAAYLQGDKINREVYLTPPVEFDRGQLWKLKKTIYGLCDAARAWYKRVKSELKSLGVTVSPLDNSLFFWHVEDILQGIICVYVDDFLFGGTQLFLDSIIKKLINKFRIGSSAKITFTYVGINFNAYGDGLTMDQDHYIQSMTKIPISTARETEKDCELTKEEKKSFRTLIGQLSWVSTHTRPDVAFETCELGGIFKTAKVSDLVRLNHLVDKIKGKSIHIYYPRLPTLKRCTIRCYSDASFGNLPKDGSQAGFIIFLESNSGNVHCPIYWQSRRIDRIVDSSLAAETYALHSGAKSAVFFKIVIGQMIKGAKVQVVCLSDNESLCKVIHSDTQPKDKWLRINIGGIRSMIENGDIDKVKWIASKDQLADPLTKRGVCRDKLINAISRK